MSVRYETRSVLAGAYRGRHRARDRRGELEGLTHTLEVVEGGERDRERVLCARVASDSLADQLGHTVTALEAEPTCKVCRARDPRFA